MANSLQLLMDQVQLWANRKDLGSMLPSWVNMTETDIGEQLRARCMVVTGTQAIVAPSLQLPDTFLHMESIRDAVTRNNLTLEDQWTGPTTPDVYDIAGGNPPFGGPVTSYRLVGNCVEFLPNPDTTDPAYVPMTVEMTWYAQPNPLVDPQDTNPVLDTLFSVYLFGVMRFAAMFELDPDRQQQAEAAFTAAIAKANQWKQVSEFSGAPLRAVQGAVF